MPITNGQQPTIRTAAFCRRTVGISYPGHQTIEKPMTQENKQKAPTGVSCIPLLGDTVEWTSQSGGYYGKVKRGKIISIVKAGEVPELNPDEPLRVLGAGFGMSRKHDSYLVRVGNIAYWPRVKHLRVVSPNDQAQARRTDGLSKPETL